MTSPRLLVAACAAVLAVAGCTSSASSAPSTTGASAASTSGAGSAAASALAARVRHGLDGVTSAHITANAGSLGGTSTGDFTFRDGTATASDITVGSGAQKTEIVTVGDTSYAKLPAGRNTSGKPWVKVSADSKNEFVRALASNLTISTAVGSLPAVADVIATSSNVQDKGTTTMDGVSAHRYSLAVVPSGAASNDLGALLAEIGQKTVPVDVYLDAQGRPVHVTVAVKIGGQSFDFQVAVSDFDKPVTITAPPAAQVAG